jgi:hypothetical protein
LTEVAVIITAKPDAVMGGKRQGPVEDRSDHRERVIQQQRRARKNHRV